MSKCCAYQGQISVHIRTDRITLRMFMDAEFVTEVSDSTLLQVPSKYMDTSIPLDTARQGQGCTK